MSTAARRSDQTWWRTTARYLPLTSLAALVRPARIQGRKHRADGANGFASPG
ncbi:MAG TPA: hypothetical protein VN969_12125 [Streptosporangiaceae bacterium]|nr:hypothetical protein [Streptosporangiaceae bacterium]